MGKQMVAGYACWCAHKQKCWVAAGRYREVSAGMRWRVFPSRSAFEMLERYAMKVARTVLRGGNGSNATPLPDLLAARSWFVLKKILDSHKVFNL
jgi:hypothetical protein